MEKKLKFCAIAAFATMLIVVANGFAIADTYHTATFSGRLFSSPNVKAPFTSELSPGGTVTGSFVIDDSLIPGSGTGFVNVGVASFPDITKIPFTLAFTINLGAADLTFDLADAIQNSGAIQFNHGNFVGFFFDTDSCTKTVPIVLTIKAEFSA